jgi:two-component system, NarL family, invasion response regulator UvrY
MNIGIVDDHSLFRDGLKHILKDKEFVVTMEASNGMDMAEKLAKLPKAKVPGIMVVDINMPIMDGFEAVLWLKKNHKEIKVMVLTMRFDEDSIIRMLKLGVNCYFTKIVEQNELLKALRVINKEGQYFTKDITNTLVDNLKQENKSDKSSKVQLLTENEIRFIKLACSESTYPEIAKQMGLSGRTIDGYREIVFSKLGIKSRVTLALFAVKNGLFKL